MAHVIIYMAGFSTWTVCKSFAMVVCKSQDMHWSLVSWLCLAICNSCMAYRDISWIFWANIRSGNALATGRTAVLWPSLATACHSHTAAWQWLPVMHLYRWIQKKLKCKALWPITCVGVERVGNRWNGSTGKKRSSPAGAALKRMPSLHVKRRSAFGQPVNGIWSKVMSKHLYKIVTVKHKCET